MAQCKTVHGSQGSAPSTGGGPARGRAGSRCHLKGLFFASCALVDIICRRSQITVRKTKQVPPKGHLQQQKHSVAEAAQGAKRIGGHFGCLYSHRHPLAHAAADSAGSGSQTQSCAWITELRAAADAVTHSQQEDFRTPDTSFQQSDGLANSHRSGTFRTWLALWALEPARVGMRGLSRLAASVCLRTLACELFFLPQTP